jgi:hypothetical protein
MEGELWSILYRWILEEASKRWRTKHVQFSDAWILGVYCWSVLNDRSVSWACESRNWPETQRWRELPSDSTMSDRLRTLPVLQLLEALLNRLAALQRPGLVHAVDGKPLPVGGYSKDRDARWGQAAGHKAKGYKLFDIWSNGVVPAVWRLGAMNEPEPDVAREELVPNLSSDYCGYLLGDALYDSNPLHETCASRELQLVAPRRKPYSGLGHREHHPARLRSIQLTETPAPGATPLPEKGPAPFGRELYRMRGRIERRQGNLCSFSGGLSPLPAWVRRPRRIARWVAVKLVINGLRQSLLEGLMT